MPKRPIKKNAKASVVHSSATPVTGVSGTKKKQAPNKARPARPKKKQDVQDIERADSEGMAQPQGIKPTKKRPAAAGPGRKRGAKSVKRGPRR